MYLLLRPASAWICKNFKNPLSSGYQDLMAHLILTTQSLIYSELNYINDHRAQTSPTLRFCLKKTVSPQDFYKMTLSTATKHRQSCQMYFFFFFSNHVLIQSEKVYMSSFLVIVHSVLEQI